MKKLLLSILAVVAAGCGYYSAAAETTISFGTDNSDLGGTSGISDLSSKTLKSGNVSISFAKGNSSSTPAYNKAGEIRLYGGKSTSDLDGNTMTVASTNNITSIYLAKGSSCTWGTLTADCGEIAIDTDHNATWTGNAESVTFTVSRNSDKTGTSTQWRLKSAKITEAEDTDTTKCATPTFSVEPGVVAKGTRVKISCATEGAMLHYTLNDSAAEREANTVTVTINETTTITAIASKIGLEDSDVAEATYTVKEYVNATSIADAYTKMGVADLASNASTEEFKVAFEPVVTYANGANAYIYDGEKYGLIFAYNNGLNAGDKIVANWKAAIKNYANLYEFIPSDTLATNGTANVPDAVEITPAQLIADNQSMLVVMNNVVLSAATPAATVTGSARGYKGTVDGTEISLFNNFKNASVEAGTYNITGIVGVYNTTVQLQPISFDKVQVIETKCATPTFSIESGVVAKGTQVTISCATEGATLLYTLNDSIAESETNTVTVTINETTTITVVASKTGLEDSDEAEATYTVSEQGGDTPTGGTAVFKVSTVTDPADGAELANGSAGNLIGQSFTDNGVTLAFSANSPSNSVGIFNSDKEVRWYANNFITITPAQKTVITEIYVRTVSNSKGNFSASIDGKAVETVSGTGVGASNPITWTGEANAPILLTPNAQVRFSYITVKFKGDTTGVEDVTVADENAPVEYYNLQGVRVNNPEGGVYIRRQGNTVTKVLVK